MDGSAVGPRGGAFAISTPTTLIDRTARVEPGARIGEGVALGPFCIIGAGVTIGRGTELIAHVSILGDVTLGEANRLSPCVIGGEAQDVASLGKAGAIAIGDGNVFREGVTVHLAGSKEDGVTRIGSQNTLSSGSHVAHDCRLGDHIKLGPGVLLGGHVRVGSHAEIAMGSVVVHNATVGEYCLVGMKSKVSQDAPPYTIVEGNPAAVRRINTAALKRAGFARKSIVALHEAHRLVFRARMSLARAAEVLEAAGAMTPEVARLLAFLRDQQAGRNGRSLDRHAPP